MRLDSTRGMTLGVEDESCVCLLVCGYLQMISWSFLAVSVDHVRIEAKSSGKCVLFSFFVHALMESLFV